MGPWVKVNVIARMMFYSQLWKFSPRNPHGPQLHACEFDNGVQSKILIFHSAYFYQF